MTVTLSLLLLALIAIVFFSEELIGYIKRLLDLPGGRLIFPLLLASIFVEYFEPGLLWIFLSIKEKSVEGIAFLQEHLPFKQWRGAFVSIVLLVLLSQLPVWIAFVSSRLRKRKRRPWPHAATLGLNLWIVMVILLLV